jgi:hypothetical protein
MKELLCVWLLLFTTGFCVKPEDGPYAPSMSGEFWRKGELFPSSLGLRPWKPADAKAYAGRFVGLAEPASVIELKVRSSSAADGTRWRTDGNWKIVNGSDLERTISWTGASLELDSKHTYAEAARGCFFIFFVLYRDPDLPAAEFRPALLIGDRLFPRE